MTASRTRVKICGLTTFDDAELAVSLGADALGFVFWPKSPRAVQPEDAGAIARRLPPFVTRVGVFVDSSPADVAAVSAVAGIDVAQLHGQERPEDYTGRGARVLRATSLRSDAEVDQAAGWPLAVVPIVDAHDPERRGGTGVRADWTRAAALAGRRPIVLAGGLSADNVREAIVTVRPWAVDVSSGVEVSPGRKSPERLRAFFAAVAAVNVEDR